MTTIPAAGSGGCLDCHETTGCLTPTKPQGTCASCHLDSADVNDYLMNFTAATIDSGEWQTEGHGQSGIAMECEYCHDYDVRHGEPTNPFRLANTSTPGAAGQNTNCLACHGTDSAGFDPDGADTTFSLFNSVVKIDSNHAGSRHNDLTDGGYFCWDCHDPHGDTNRSMIHDEVSRQTDGEFGIPTLTAPVSFIANLTGTDYAGSTAPFDGICQACHTSANHYTSTSGDRHNEQYRCVTCHEHQDGFKPNCNACHGYPPEVDTPQGVDGLVVIPQATGSFTAGAHATHAVDYGYSCYTCHFDGMPDTPIFDDYRIQMGFDILGFNGAGSTYNGQSSLNAAYSYQGTNGTAISNTGTPTTCTNIYCHSNGTAVATSFADPTNFPGPNQSSPAWDGSTGCTSCHNYGPAYAEDQPKANKHGRHLNLFTNLQLNYDENPCHFCHYNTTTDGMTITNRANHVNRQYDVTPDTGAIFFQNATTPIPVNFSYSFDPGGGTCSNISCHQGIMTETANWGSNIEASYSWSAGSGCGSVSFTIFVTSANAEPPYQYKIDWESDGVWDYEGPDNQNLHTYSDTATQYITFSVRDANGRTLAGDGSEQTGPINPPSTNALPVVAVSASTSGYTVTLTDQSFDPDYNSCGHTGSGRVMIDWGPGGYVYYDFDPPLSDSPSGQQFSHTYSSSGPFTIRYGVYDNVITYPVFHDNIRVTVPQN